MISYYKDEGVRVVVADLVRVRVRIRVRAKYSEPAVACIQCNDALQTIYMDCTQGCFYSGRKGGQVAPSISKRGPHGL